MTDSVVRDSEGDLLPAIHPSNIVVHGGNLAPSVCTYRKRMDHRGNDPMS